MFLHGDDSLELSFRQKKASRFAIIVLFALAMISLFIPLSMLLVLGINATSLFGLILFALVGSYFVKLYLWNSQGLEALSISKEQIVHTLDYHLFKDVTSMKNEGIILRVSPIETEGTKSGDGILDNEELSEERLFQLSFSNAENDIIELNEKLTAEYVGVFKKVLNVEEN
ncbi:MAG: hypothetical protein AAFV25_12265 [Bacteroidota bacterium]